MIKNQFIESLDFENNNYRYERKFTTDQLSYQQIENIIKIHPGFFKQIFHQRRVNNIYFDTPNLDFYNQNKDGAKERKKVRIRWYGETFSRVDSPVLEVKLKNGLVGDKWQFPFNPFSIPEELKGATLKNRLLNSKLPKSVLDLIKQLRPTLLNSYQRKYYQTVDKRYRVTIDDALSYKNLNKNLTVINSKMIRDMKKVIVELKYNLDDDPQSESISNMFPFRLNKSSKYCDGIDIFLSNF